MSSSFKEEKLQRELANNGHQLLEAQFKHDTITGLRNGNGILHVRSKTDLKLDDVLRIIRSFGINVDVSETYQPCWK